MLLFAQVLVALAILSALGFMFGSIKNGVLPRELNQWNKWKQWPLWFKLGPISITLWLVGMILVGYVKG